MNKTTNNKKTVNKKSVINTTKKPSTTKPIVNKNGVQKINKPQNEIKDLDKLTNTNKVINNSSNTNVETKPINNLKSSETSSKIVVTNKPKNKKKTKIIIFSILGALALIGGATAATVIVLNNNNNSQKVVTYNVSIDGVSGISILNQKKLDDGSYEISLKNDNDSKAIDDVNLKIGDNTLVSETDYIFDEATNKINIKKETLDKNTANTNISIKPVLANKISNIQWNKNIKVPNVGDTTPYRLGSRSKEIYFGTPNEYPEIIKDTTYNKNLIGETSDDLITAYFNMEAGKLFILSKYTIMFDDDDGVYVEERQGFFYNYSDIEKITFGKNIDFSDVNKQYSFTYRLFKYCRKLKEINGFENIKYSVDHLLSLDTTFYDCEALVSINLSSLDFTNVTTINSPFYYCSSLEKIIFPSKVNSTNKLEAIHGMFKECSKLTELDLSWISTTSLIDTYQMFYKCSALETIYVNSSFDNSNITSSEDMFKDCTSLVGGNGTTCDGSTNIDKTYARIDTTNNPGYFTEKE